MLRPSQTLTLPARSLAQVFHLIEGGVKLAACGKHFDMVEADTLLHAGLRAGEHT